jgi:hypothetical protein
MDGDYDIYSISIGLVEMIGGKLTINNLEAKNIKIVDNSIIKLNDVLKTVNIIGCEFENIK